MKAIACLAAAGVVRDADTNAVSVFSIYEELASVGFPFLVQNVGVFVLWQIEEDDRTDITDIQFQVRNNAHVLFQAPIAVTVSAKRHRTIIRVQGLLVREPGILRFVFTRGTQEIAGYEITVKPPVTTVETHGP